MGCRLAVGVTVLLLLAMGTSCAPQPRSAIEPLPEGLEIAGAYEVPRRRIEGPGLCLVVTGLDGESAGRTLQRLEAHLMETKGWNQTERGQFLDWAPVSLTQRGPRFLVAGPVRDFLRAATSDDDCRELEPVMSETPEGVVVNVWLWER